MHLSEFDYRLPPELIAREPANPRDASRMMVLDASTGATIESQFRDLPTFLNPSDILVLNDTRVIRARTFARLERATGTSRPIEIFFAEPVDDHVWRVLCRPGRRIQPGDRVFFEEGEITGKFRESHDAELHVLELEPSTSVFHLLERCGRVPLPPYIERDSTPADENSYQTVFADRPGAVAAPTAGLHFTEEALERVRNRGVEIVRLTLHVGIGTFMPVRTERPEDHALRPERFEIGEETAGRLRRAMQDGRRVVAVGTTTTRALEFVMREYGEMRPACGYADLFILPGFEFRIVGALLTNFHLPRSTLLMLVSAFAGRENVLAAYRRAIEQRYRFYSYGDCMLVVRS